MGLSYIALISVHRVLFFSPKAFPSTSLWGDFWQTPSIHSTLFAGFFSDGGRRPLYSLLVRRFVTVWSGNYPKHKLPWSTLPIANDGMCSIMMVTGFMWNSNRIANSQLLVLIISFLNDFMVLFQLWRVLMLCPTTFNFRLHQRFIPFSTVRCWNLTTGTFPLRLPPYHLKQGTITP